MAGQIIVDPESAWRALAGRGCAWLPLVRYTAPLLLISPLAYAGGLLINSEGALRTFDTGASAASYSVAAIAGGLVALILCISVIAAAVWLIAPLYRGEQNFCNSMRLAAYSGTPVFISGIVMLAPLQRFPLLVIMVLIAFMHALYLFYVGLHVLLGVPQRDAAECAAIVAVATVIASSIAGYIGSAAGLFPHI